MNERQIGIGHFPVSAEKLGELLKRVSAGQLDNTRARDVFAHLLENDASVENAIKALGIESVDSGELDALCRELLDANPQTVEDFRAGKKQAIGSLIGQAKKKNPNANPQQVRETLIRLIESS